MTENLEHNAGHLETMPGLFGSVVGGKISTYTPIELGQFIQHFVSSFNKQNKDFVITVMANPKPVLSDLMEVQ